MTSERALLDAAILVPRPRDTPVVQQEELLGAKVDEPIDYILIGNVDITDKPRTGLIPPLDREVDIVTHDFFQKNYEQIYLPVAGGKYLNLFRRKGS